MKSLKLFLLIFSLFITASVSAQDASGEGQLYGKEFPEGVQTVTLTELFANPETYNGQEVVVTASIVDVCQKAGCWITFMEGDKEIRVKTDHNFVLPKDSFNQTATVNGVFAIKEISEKMAKHFNEDAKNKKDVSNIVGPQKVYEIKATGIVLTNDGTESSNKTKTKDANNVSE
ncbi:MAG TPA: DUF4920 domain-containing protein [Ignavibacteria bacterium]|nr:DUF4920 domain-containing protein [Ignavibacteria bacterium]